MTDLWDRGAAGVRLQQGEKGVARVGRGQGPADGRQLLLGLLLLMLLLLLLLLELLLLELLLLAKSANTTHGWEPPEPFNVLQRLCSSNRQCLLQSWVINERRPSIQAMQIDDTLFRKELLVIKNTNNNTMVQAQGVKVYLLQSSTTAGCLCQLLKQVGLILALHLLLLRRLLRLQLLGKSWLGSSLLATRHAHHLY